MISYHHWHAAWRAVCKHLRLTRWFMDLKTWWDHASFEFICLLLKINSTVGTLCPDSIGFNFFRNQRFTHEPGMLIRHDLEFTLDLITWLVVRELSFQAAIIVPFQCTDQWVTRHQNNSIDNTRLRRQAAVSTQVPTNKDKQILNPQLDDVKLHSVEKGFLGCPRIFPSTMSNACSISSRNTCYYNFCCCCWWWCSCCCWIRHASCLDGQWLCVQASSYLSKCCNQTTWILLTAAASQF